MASQWDPAMVLALQQARLAADHGDVPVGAVVLDPAGTVLFVEAGEFLFGDWDEGQRYSLKTGEALGRSFDWDADGWQSFVSDPEVPPIMKEAGHKGPPQVAEVGPSYDA